jgi:hypothetical protein
MLKYKRTKAQTMIYKALYRKLQIEQHEPTETGINSGAQFPLSIVMLSIQKLNLKIILTDLTCYEKKLLENVINIRQ